MSSIQVDMIAGLPYIAFRDAVLTHPTLGGSWGVFSSEPIIQMSRAALG